MIASTASPYKFATSVMTAIDAKYEGMDDFALIDELSKVSGVSIPQAVEEIRSARFCMILYARLQICKRL